MLPLHLTDADLDANRCLIAQAIGTHPVALVFTPSTVAALSAIATGETPVSTAAERHLLRQALHAIDLAELAISRRAPA